MAIASIVQRATASVRKRLYDNFAGRANTAESLGTATDGSQWTAVSGTLAVNSGLAKGTATATPAVGSSYPIATVSMPTGDNVISIVDTGNGASAAVWVQSSSDWWMVSLDSTFNTIPGNTNYTSGTITYTSSAASYTSGAGTYTSGATGYTLGATTYTLGGTTYTSGATQSYTAPTSYTQGAAQPSGFASGTAYVTVYTRNTYNQPTYGFLTKTTYRVSGYSGSYSAYSTGSSPYTQYSTTYATPYTSAAGGTYSFVPYTTNNPYTSGIPYSSSVPYTSNTPYTSTNSPYTSNAPYTSNTNAVTYAYQAIIKVNKSLSNTVTTVTSAIVSTTQTIRSILVSTSGNQITARAFSDTNLVTQLGSDLVYTATGAVVSTTYGISIAPTQYAQSDTIGSSVNISRA